ncbi:transcription elongation factor spt5 [Lithohypha guttulata]|uniref:Transcription elongation factor SPT5 n=1 Tax=Lithohypha guttulata TaxID=1690604 RepID=A0AAN7TBS4_9EURO|nr:transcription elongation factor spt5 [Lithohypha guttulata]
MASFLNTTFDDEESETEFNPGAEQGSENEGSDNEDTKVQPSRKVERASPVPEANGSRPKQRDSPVNDLKDDDEDDNNGEDDEGEGEDLQDGDDDEEDEEEEDEDDEDALVGRPKKRRRRGLNQFIEEEAEVDEDDDELEADEDDIAETGFIQDTHPDDDLGADVEQDDRRHRELDRQRQLEQSMDAEAQANRYKERYGRRTTTGLAKGSFVPQNLLMPSVNDPSIWSVACKPGKERETIGFIMKRQIERSKMGKPLRICSAFERGGTTSSMAGMIFVEARRVDDMKEALTGVPNVYMSKITKFPLNEMPDLLRVRKTKQLEIGGYARIRKQGVYFNDLAVIEEVEDNGLDVVVRLVPRLDYGLNEDDNKPTNPAEKRKRNAFAPAATPLVRPPQRLFNENEAKKKHSRFLTQNRALSGRSWIYKNDTYEDGYLWKTFRRSQLQTENVDPKLEEVTKLTRQAVDGSETLDIEQIAKDLKNSTAEGNYVPGDEIEVYKGEQRGLVGRVEGVSDRILRVKVIQGELAGQVIEQPVSDVRKRFREGDHVKVIGASKYAGEIGMIIKIKDDRVTIITDTSNQEITVFSRDLREAAEAGGTEIKSHMFDVQDLVQLNATQVGIVIRADLEAVRILDENSSVVTRLPTQLQKVEQKKNAVATDRNSAEIRVGDTVRESGGEGKTGRILHIHRAHLFLHDRERMENSGLWTTRCMNVVTIASKANMTQSGPDLTKMNPMLNGQRAPGAMAPPPQVGRDRLIGQTVHIRKGHFKGHRGIVKDTQGEVARVELQSKNKVINIPKVDLAVVDRNTDKTIDYNTFAHSRGPAFPLRTGTGATNGSRVPDSGFQGGRTPQVGSATPMWGSSSRTPAWNGAGSAMDSRTPTWKASGSATTYGGSGNMTSYGGPGNYGTNNSSNRTPAWSSSAKTPYSGDHGYGSSSGGYDAFAASSRTPFAGGASSRTPAYNSGMTENTSAISAPTPSGFDSSGGGYTSYAANAPTPGAGFGSGPVDAPTPGMPSYAKASNQIPLKHNRLAAAAATPGATYDAPTPGGPRYAEDDDDD